MPLSRLPPRRDKGGQHMPTPMHSPTRRQIILKEVTTLFQKLNMPNISLKQMEAKVQIRQTWSQNRHTQAEASVTIVLLC